MIKIRTDSKLTKIGSLLESKVHRPILNSFSLFQKLYHFTASRKKCSISSKRIQYFMCIDFNAGLYTYHIVFGVSKNAFTVTNDLSYNVSRYG